METEYGLCELRLVAALTYKNGKVILVALPLLAFSLFLVKRVGKKNFNDLFLAAAPLEWLFFPFWLDKAFLFISDDITALICLLRNITQQADITKKNKRFCFVFYKCFKF